MIQENAEVTVPDSDLPKYSVRIKSNGQSWKQSSLADAIEAAHRQRILQLQISCNMLGDTTTVQGRGVGIDAAVSNCFENLAHLIQQLEQLNR